MRSGNKTKTLRYVCPKIVIKLASAAKSLADCAQRLSVHQHFNDQVSLVVPTNPKADLKASFWISFSS